MKKLSNISIYIIIAIFIVSCSDTYKEFLYNEYGNIGNGWFPVVIINTPNNKEIKSKETYIDNTLVTIIDADGKEELSEIASIKGHGNSTWGKDKSPYAIKFNKKQKVLSMPEDKSWILLANYFDPTLMRNDIAFYMGRELSNLDYTPRFQYVYLILNGKNQGLYQLGEKVKIAEERVNIGDDGILMEIDRRSLEENHARYFTLSHVPDPIRIKEPKVAYDDPNFFYAKDFVTKADSILYSADFLQNENGWKSYMDMDSFIDWYLINEIAKNKDAYFQSSCFMNFSRNGKLKMGPIWDFDVAFGNFIWEPYASDFANIETDFYIKNLDWYTRMCEDPVFISRLKERFNYFFANRQQIYDRINTNALIIKGEIVKENKLYGRLCSPSTSEEDVKKVYQQKVNDMKEWIEKRFLWLNIHINNL